MLALLLLLALAATAAGGVLPEAAAVVKRLGLWRMLAFRSGLLVAVAFADVLPGAWLLAPFVAGWSALLGFIAGYAAENFSMSDPCHEAECRSHALGLTALAALFFHSLVDGFNLGAVSLAGASALAAAGVSMTVHKFADGFTLTSLFRQAGYGRGRTAAGLAAVALATPAGALLSRAGLVGLGPVPLSAILGFAGGSFIYIAASDTLPRLHHERDRLSLASFGLGLGSMAVLHYALR